MPVWFRAPHFLWLTLLVLAAALCQPAGAWAASAEGNARAEVVRRALAAEEIQRLSFGYLEVGKRGGSVFVNALAPKGKTVGQVRQTAPGQRGRYLVRGQARRLFRVRAEPSGIAEGIRPRLMVVPPVGWLDASGRAEFHVDGVLSLSGGQPAGTYYGEYTLTVEYQ